MESISNRGNKRESIAGPRGLEDNGKKRGKNSALYFQDTVLCSQLCPDNRHKQLTLIRVCMLVLGLMY